MGNAESNVTSGVKNQAGGVTQPIYKLVDLTGGGLLIDLAKQAATTKNYAALDEAIRGKVQPYLYNNGNGKLIHVSRLVLMRNKERPKSRQIFKTEEEAKNYKEPDDKDPSMYRDVCWNLDDRGAVGETLLHLCFLSASSVHADLARRLLKYYPKMINDVYMSDEYYGENVLHMCIVNEDPQTVKYLLDTGVNYMERCTGCFMSPEDQKASRTDLLTQENVYNDPITNYEGYVYWGEYPASFAACLDQEECYRLILAKGADPNAQDSNGNTVLHMLVIHEKLHNFDFAFELGADIHIFNRVNLSPLTLAAKLAKKEMFFHILNIEREIYWHIGSLTSAAYPLTQLDTINTSTGKINKDSALNLIVFGEKVEHLDLLEGVIIDILHAKWKTFVKAKFYKQFFSFVIYFLISLTAMVLRPIHTFGPKQISALDLSQNYTNLTLNLFNSNQTNLFALFPSPTPASGNFSQLLGLIGEKTIIENFRLDINDTDFLLNGTLGEKGIKCIAFPKSSNDWILMVCEILVFLGAIAFLLGAIRERLFLGSSMFWGNIATVPSRVLFLFSCILVLVMAILRAFCLQDTEDIVAVIVMLSTAPFFLYFCRGFKTVGPFVVMIYRMITGDLLRFVIIYLVFVMGFSQAFYIIFLSYKGKKENNPMGKNPVESVITMFLMSLADFDDAFAGFAQTDHEAVAVFLFILYMVIVSLLLINLLIAMMGDTYTKIAEIKNEWQRQWARIVLVVERCVSPAERHRRQALYSQIMADGTRALVLRLNQTEEEKEEMKELIDTKRYHLKAVARRKKKQQEMEELATMVKSKEVNSQSGKQNNAKEKKNR